MWSTKFSKFSEKRAKPLSYFFYFPKFFGNFVKPNRPKASLGLVQMMLAAVKISDFSDKRAKSCASFTEGISSYVFQKAQHGVGGGS